MSLPTEYATAGRAIAVRPRAAMAMLNLVSTSAPSISLVRRGPLQDRQLVGTIRMQRGAEELPRLPRGVAPLQIDRDKLRRFVGVLVNAVAQPLTDDLADPRVIVRRAVDAVGVKFVREVHVRISVRRRGHGNGNGESDHRNDASSLHGLNLGLSTPL